jgi:hypothetical protein
MRILMTGATGLIGRELGKLFAARGDVLVCLVRDPPSAGGRLPFPATCVAWDHTREVPSHALAGVDAVVHLAGEPVAEGRWTSARKALIRDSRVLGTRRLVDAVLEHGGQVGAFVHGSASGYYGDRDDEVLTADSPKGAGFLCDVVQAWEDELRPLAARRPEVRVPVVRTGIVLARQGGALAKMLPMFRASAAGRLGSGRQWMSWIHLEDIVRLFVHALDSTATGAMEGVAPRPATNREFTSALCRSLGVFENAPVPAAAIRLLFGEMGAIVLESARIEPRRTLAGGFRFRFESVGDALADLLAPMRGGTWEKTWEQWIPRSPEELWPYFCDAHNLQELTPEFLNFRVLGTSTKEIGQDTLIDYRLALERVPIRWRSRIEAWEPPSRFVDAQVKGPYALWRHAHEFHPLAGGTLMRDVVRYRLPLGWIGRLAAGWKVEAYVGRIFSHRSSVIARRFAR